MYQPCANKALLVINQKTSKKVFISDVMLLRAEINYTQFILSSGIEMLVAHPIRYFEDFLKTHGFIRVHRRYMVNPFHVTSYDLSLNSLTLRNGHTALISRRRKSSFPKDLKRNKIEFYPIDFFTQK